MLYFQVSTCSLLCFLFYHINLSFILNLYFFIRNIFFFTLYSKSSVIFLSHHVSNFQHTEIRSNNRGVYKIQYCYDRAVCGAKATDVHRQTDKEQGSHSIDEQVYG